jgi:lipopolysaccharide assembly outer membrane protein LptD (OstA)
VLLNKLYAIFLLYLSSVISLLANLPELSSINPIEFDEVAQKLVASNEATFDFKNIRLKADVITYYKNYNLLNARGGINFVSNNHRLLSDDFALDVQSNTFSINNIKYGTWPYYISAKSGGGNEERIQFNQGVFYYGNPHPLSPNLKAQTVSIVNKDNKKEVIFKNTFLRIGNVPIFYLPKILIWQLLDSVTKINLASTFKHYRFSPYTTG